VLAVASILAHFVASMHGEKWPCRFEMLILALIKGDEYNSPNAKVVVA
jgi:hypothetical protein